LNRQGLWPVLIILLINSLLAIGVLILAFSKERKNKSTLIMLSCFILIVPLIGPIYILLGLLINRLTRKGNVDMSDVSFSQEREKIILPPDQDKEMNYVPIHDAMVVSDNASLRRLLLDTMLTKAKDRISNIAIAMNSSDTEASHYAASITMDVLSELRATAQNMLESMQRLPEDVEMNLLTFDYLYEFISLGIMSKVEQEASIYTLDDVADNLFTYNLWYMTASHYLKITDLFISIRDYNMADKWSQRASQYRPNMLDTYKAKLHLYFEQRNYNAFFECLEELKNSEISVDKEIIDLFHLYYSLA
jgi:tetratricopeptide (TPR) repeat protein